MYSTIQFHFNQIRKLVCISKNVEVTKKKKKVIFIIQQEIEKHLNQTIIINIAFNYASRKKVQEIIINTNNNCKW